MFKKLKPTSLLTAVVSMLIISLTLAVVSLNYFIQTNQLATSQTIRSLAIKTNPQRIFISTEERIETKTLAFETKNQTDADLFKDQIIVKQLGKEGQREDKLLITLHNGQEHSRQVLSSKIIRQPVHKIVVTGVKPRPHQQIASASQNVNFNQFQARQMLTFVNQERHKHNLPKLVYNYSLEAYAKIRAQEIVRKFDHYRPNGLSFSSVGPGVNGENILASNLTTTGSLAVDKFMASEPHRINILRPDFKTFGGAYLIDGKDEYKNFWVQLFGL